MGGGGCDSQDSDLAGCDGGDGDFAADGRDSDFTTGVVVTKLLAFW